jgi:hypothetical protein
VREKKKKGESFKERKKETNLCRDLIHTQHHYNNHTTTLHMSVGPSLWGPPLCEGLLCGCCIGVVNLTFSICVIKKETIREIEREGEGMVEEFATHVVAPLDMTWLLFTPGGTLHSLQYIIISLAVKSA